MNIASLVTLLNILPWNYYCAGKRHHYHFIRVERELSSFESFFSAVLLHAPTRNTKNRFPPRVNTESPLRARAVTPPRSHAAILHVRIKSRSDVHPNGWRMPDPARFARRPTFRTNTVDAVLMFPKAHCYSIRRIFPPRVGFFRLHR